MGEVYGAIFNPHKLCKWSVNDKGVRHSMMISQVFILRRFFWTDLKTTLHYFVKQSSINPSKKLNISESFGLSCASIMKAKEKSDCMLCHVRNNCPHKGQTGSACCSRPLSKADGYSRGAGSQQVGTGGLCCSWTRSELQLSSLQTHWPNITTLPPPFQTPFFFHLILSPAPNFWLL